MDLKDVQRVPGAPPQSPTAADALNRLVSVQGLQSFAAEPGGNPVSFEVGQRVADYEIVGLLGVGGMGRVYRVRHAISHRTEAMKVLLADLNAEPNLAARFLGEIRTLAGLDHPNIAQLHTALQLGNELVMVMEFVDGLTLQQLARQAPLSLEEVVDYMHQVLAALSFAHSSGVVHRDIKPANIMITPQGAVKLTDFGIAKSKVEFELTRPGTTVGSLYYMSPEQAHGGCAVDGRSDIYSVGITMYELLAGRRPFEDESAYVILHNQLHVVPRPPIELNPLLSKPLSDLILKCLEKDPARRFQNAAAVSDALRRVTGIAPATPLESGGVFDQTMNVEARGKRTFGVPAASRFSPAVRRGMWMASEALAIATVLVCTALALPHFMKSGAATIPVSHTLTQSPSLPAAAVPIPTREVLVASTPAMPAALPADDSTSTPATAPYLPQAHVSAAPVTPRTRPAGPKISRAAYHPVSLPDAAPEAEEERKPVLSGATLADLQQVRTQKVALDARAGAVRLSVQRLKSEKEADGEGLSQDVAGAYVRMNAYLGAEKQDMEEGDVAAARDHLDKAAYEVSTLEKLFGK